MLSFLNTTASARTISVYLIRLADAGTPAAKNQIWNAVAVPITTSLPRGLICYEAINQVLNPGDQLWAVASADTSITPYGSVVEFS